MDLGVPRAVEHGHTAPRSVVAEDQPPWRQWVVRVAMGGGLMLAGAGGHSLADRDGVDTARMALEQQALQVRVDAIAAQQAAQAAADEESRKRIAKLEAEMVQIREGNQARDRLMLANLDVMVVGLRDISERLARIESRGGGTARPMPEELKRGLNDLDIDRIMLRRSIP